MKRRSIVENSMTSSSSDHDSSASLPSPPKQALMDDDFMKTLEQLSKQQSSQLLTNVEQSIAPQQGNFRTVLKRPDLKGSFRCSICQKIFCHSSSLSRHRMQAHFKSYTCTLCRKEITNLKLNLKELLLNIIEQFHCMIEKFNQKET
ncbi:unnamed protein product [Onchocerca flexuosa]|uniref:C2H2-type domain-containing protein n=1 Tax=Onchocerca flexuosa TaxID=387005 RepID=A0A183HD97_9BILA|nr:unnamed protein product [Onchocerca flexuosa]